MSTDQEASETNGHQAPSANTNNPPAGNPPAGNSPAGNPPAGVPPPKWTRFAPRTPTNPVARPSSERGGDRRDGHGGHGGRRPQRPQKHHQRGGGGLPPRGMMMKPSGPLGMSDDYDMPASATPVCQPQGAPGPDEAASLSQPLVPRGPGGDVYQPPVRENLPDLYLTDLQKRRSPIFRRCCRTPIRKILRRCASTRSFLRSSAVICAGAER